ncbi:MAG: metal-sensitive transcriptional regulator [bacterium]
MADEALTDQDSPQDIEKLLNRAARIKGQVGGIERMLEEEAYCIDLINQIHSVNQALNSLATEVLERHLDTCVRDAINSGDPLEEQQKLEEFMDAVSHYLKK